MDIHSYDVQLAREIGIKEAVLYRYFQYWVEYNKAYKLNYFDGEYWTFNSIGALAELFPEFNRDQIRRIIDNLLEKGLIKKGNYNKTPMDRTLWYTICENCQIHLANLPNAIGRNAKPIPISNTINNTTKESVLVNTLEKSGEQLTLTETITETEQPQKIDLNMLHESMFYEFYMTYPKKKAKSDAFRAFMKIKDLDTEFPRIMEALKRQINSKDWLKDNGKFIPYPATWLNGRRWEDEVSTQSEDFNNMSDFEKSIVADALRGT